MIFLFNMGDFLVPCYNLTGCSWAVLRLSGFVIDVFVCSCLDDHFPDSK